MARWLSIAIVLTIPALPGCGQEAPGPALVEQSRLAMGSALQIAVWTSDRRGATRAIDAVFAEFERLDRLLSVWQPDSEVQRLNQAAGHGPVPIGPDLAAVLQAAAEGHRRTGGRFDITFGALSDVWRFDHDQDNRVPTPEEIAARLPSIGAGAVKVDPAAGTAEIMRPGVRVHLGGIGKGYAVDRGAAMLRQAGFHDFLIQAGGDLYAAGRRGDRAWRVRLFDPRGTNGETFAAIDLYDETFSTSGDYERFFIKDGIRYHHILDPATGQPARLSRSVTILARDALTADWASTGAFILGPEPGMALIESLPGVEGVIVGADNGLTISSGLRDRLKVDRPPTP